jgi:hypothetical protein
MKPWRVPLGLCLWAGAAGMAQAAGVVLLSGATATEARLEPGLALPDGSGIDRDGIALGARALGARDATPILWFVGGGVLRLDELPPDQRVAYYCAARDAEAFERGQAIVLPAPLPLDPVLWVTAMPDRFLWWPEAPGPEACGLAVALLDPSPASVDFGDVALGASVARPLKLTNVGRIEVELGTLSVSGTGFSKTLDPCSGTELLPGQACTLSLTFAPGSTAGALAGQLSAPNSGLTPGLSVPLAGRGLAPGVLQADPVALAFGDVLLGASLRRSVQVSNGGDVAVPLGATSVAGSGFVVATDTCAGTTLDPAETCAIALDFSPGASADYSETLSLVRTDAATPLTVVLTGRGVAPAALQADPLALAFGDVLIAATLRRTLQVTNSGGVATLLGTTSVVGSGFVVATDTCAGTTLDPAETCAIALDFRPAASTAYSASLSLARSDGAALEVGLSGRGVAPAQLQADPPALAFGDVAIAATLRRTVQVTNTGGVAALLGATGVAGSGFLVATDTCAGTTLDPAEVCAIALDFTPAAGADYSGTLSLARSDGAALDVGLGGRGVAPAQLQVDPLELAFGDVEVGSTLRRSLQVSNPGGVDLALGAAGVVGTGYALATDGCSGTTLAPAQACQIAVDFTPLAAAAYDGTLSVARAAGAGASVALSGVGLPAPPQGDHVFGSGFEGP